MQYFIRYKIFITLILSNFMTEIFNWNNIHANAESFQKSKPFPFGFIENVKLKDLVSIIEKANDAFFNTDEMGFYKNADDLLNQMDKLCGNINKINKIFFMN